MQLSPRKQAIMTAIVKCYIETGEPIGSKMLQGLIENAPSSATLRNEMSELCGLGLLSQPHTSAGRIPTSSGYRFYVNTLMHPSAIMDSTKQYIDSLISEFSGDIEDFPVIAAKALYELTGFPAIYCYVAENGLYLRRVKLMPISRRAVMMFAVLSDGRTKSRICHLQTEFSDEIKSDFEFISEKKIGKTPLIELTPAKVQNIIAEANLTSFDIMPLVTALFEIAQDVTGPKADITGINNLYNFCSDDSARQIISMIKHPEAAISLLVPNERDTSVIFGNEIRPKELSDKVIIVSRYSCKGNPRGSIGIIAPSRISYEQIIPGVKYTAGRLSTLLSKAVDDMED